MLEKKMHYLKDEKEVNFLLPKNILGGRYKALYEEKGQNSKFGPFQSTFLRFIQKNFFE